MEEVNVYKRVTAKLVSAGYMVPGPTLCHVMSTSMIVDCGGAVHMGCSIHRVHINDCRLRFGEIPEITSTCCKSHVYTDHTNT